MPGESVRLSCNIINSESERTVKCTTVKLIRLITGIDIGKEKSIKKPELLFKHQDDTIINKGQEKTLIFEVPLRIIKIVNGLPARIVTE
jgi:hypothetical protein